MDRGARKRGRETNRQTDVHVDRVLYVYTCTVFTRNTEHRTCACTYTYNACVHSVMIYIENEVGKRRKRETNRTDLKYMYY